MTTKDILGCIIDNNKGIIFLSLKRKAELLYLLDIPPTSRRMSLKLLDGLIDKLQSMHLVVLVSIGHFYAIQVDPTRAQATNHATEYLSAQFHQDVHFWIEIFKDMGTRPTYLTEIVHRDTLYLGYCDASSMEAGGMWVDPNKDGVNRVWWVQ